MQRIFQTALILSVLGIQNSTAQDKMGGLALYTVREDMGTNAKATLQVVADTGYKNIEAAGYKDGQYYGMSPIEFKTYVKRIGLKPISTHQSDITLDNMSTMFVDAKAAGFKYFVVPIPPMGLFTHNQETQIMGMTGTVENLAKIINEMGETAHKAGLKLLYHNHDFEFKKNEAGIVPIDYLLENCNPKFVNFQIDLFWVTKAGADPIAYFKKYPKRFKIWHVKDMDDKGRFAPVGKGNIDFDKILSQKKLSGMKYYMVEQDQTFDNMKPLEAIEISREGIEKIGFKK